MLALALAISSPWALEAAGTLEISIGKTVHIEVFRRLAHDPLLEWPLISTAEPLENLRVRRPIKLRTIKDADVERLMWLEKGLGSPVSFLGRKAYRPVGAKDGDELSFSYDIPPNKRANRTRGSVERFSIPCAASFPFESGEPSATSVIIEADRGTYLLVRGLRDPVRSETTDKSIFTFKDVAAGPRVPYIDLFFAFDEEGALALSTYYEPRTSRGFSSPTSPVCLAMFRSKGRFSRPPFFEQSGSPLFRLLALIRRSGTENRSLARDSSSRVSPTP